MGTLYYTTFASLSHFILHYIATKLHIIYTLYVYTYILFRASIYPSNLLYIYVFARDSCRKNRKKLCAHFSGCIHTYPCAKYTVYVFCSIRTKEHRKKNKGKEKMRGVDLTILDIARYQNLLFFTFTCYYCYGLLSKLK